MSEAIIAQKGPHAFAVEAGKKYAWCACGRSKKQPFCDGSHKVTALRPVVFTAETSEAVYLCGCKRSAGRPLCDGTHETV
ncbi:MAG: CDGSH iron-sulfur domain-containing protein [Proteobacteria bacterium]|nr:CDGSH iron-sulfur domain-containing protein [Pseudomonadota bacterium]